MKTFKDKRLEELDCILQSAKSIQDLSKKLEQFLSETIDMMTEDFKIKMAQSNEWWNDKLKSLSPNKEVK